MFARLTIGQVAPDRVEDAIAQGRAGKAVALRMDGCQDVYILADRKTGKWAALSLWESEEKLRASEAALTQQRDQVARAGGSGASATSEMFEVID